MRRFVLPKALRPGDVVAVIAPASPFEHVLGWRGLGFLAERYRLRFERGIFSRTGYLAGHDARRRAELERALSSPEVRAIVAARGGYGAARFCHAIDWAPLAADPKWIVGFSDITALHVEASRVGVASLHASHLTALGRGDARGRADWVDAVENPARKRRYDELSPIARGRGEGTLFGGNLTLLHACAAAGRLRMPQDTVLFLEDVTERPYRIDRMLTTLQCGGYFENVRGVVLGDFTDCPPGPDRHTVEMVVRERLGALGIPVASRLPAGHDKRNDPLLLGGWATLEVGEHRGVFELRG